VKSRSLYPVVIALALGFAAGVAFDPSVFGDDGSKSEQSPSASAFAVEGSGTADIPSRTSADRTRATGAFRTDTASNEFALSDSDEEEDPDTAYRDDTLDADDPDEFLPPDRVAVAESGAAADYAEYEDGPVRRDPLELEDESGNDDPEADGLDEELEAERCLPAYSTCRKDTDCCGFSVCRSRPGTISGYFECTAS
jgi:hypothetical protein